MAISISCQPCANFEIMVSNRDRRIWDLAQGKRVSEEIDDSNVPELPVTHQSARGQRIFEPERRGLAAFDVDPEIRS